MQIEDGKAYPQSANLPSSVDRKTFTQYGTNIIVGPLGQLTGDQIRKNVDGSISIPNRTQGIVVYW